MLEFIQSLLLAVLTAAVPVLAAHGVSLLKKVAENVATGVENAKKQGFIMEITGAVSDAVAATSQTYVDELKKARRFDADAQKEAVKKALAACLNSIGPAAIRFIRESYEDVQDYLTTRIEAEVREQKSKAGPIFETPILGEIVGTVETTVEETEG